MNTFRSGLETLTGGESASPVYGYSGAQETRTTQETLESLRLRLAGKRVALLTHPAALDGNLRHSVQHLLEWNQSLDSGRQFTLTALFGPQHGFAGEKQDNMIESDHTTDAQTGVPVFSLYGETRRLTPHMASYFDALLFDLQDVGGRVYTFLTTLSYIISDLQNQPEKEIVVLDRPNPTGRSVEGLRLIPGEESFVGAASVPMQHGMTLGEYALWFADYHRHNSRVSVVPMSGWNADAASTAWPEDRVWIPPSPNMPGLHTVRAYPGTVMLEGTTISEARGTTRPLSMFGHPAVDWARVYRRMSTIAPESLEGCRLREVTFEPAFHKHTGTPTPGFDIVCEYPFYDPNRFVPYRLVVAMLRAVREEHPELKLWSDPPYEYEYHRRPIDVICGGPGVREFVDGRLEDTAAAWRQFSQLCKQDEQAWRELTRSYYIYEAGRGSGDNKEDMQ
jgi:uncharacterized protein YbbC (DUF1343 family)